LKYKSWQKRSSEFGFSHCTANKINKVISGRGSTTAVGNNGVPISVYKNGVGGLAGPIAHLVNCIFNFGVVPQSFKEGVIIPVYKGHGKNCAQAASYRPVSLLPPLSRVLEVVAKGSHEDHLAKINALPVTQFGFQCGRLCAMALLATAHATWLGAAEAGKIIGVLAFDLSAAFDTLDPAVLIPKLEVLGVLGLSLRWFTLYLTGGSQMVDWEGSRSSTAKVHFGVCQGSILGSLLFLIHMADLPDAIGVGMRSSSSNRLGQAIFAPSSRQSHLESDHTESVGHRTAEQPPAPGQIPLPVGHGAGRGESHPCTASGHCPKTLRSSTDHGKQPSYTDSPQRRGKVSDGGRSALTWSTRPIFFQKRE
jgi:hypothetical protein